jgi:hypothetical protein
MNQRAGHLIFPCTYSTVYETRQTRRTPS